MKLYVLDADYVDDENQSVIRLFCKDIKGETVVCLDHDFKPYFYVLPFEGKEKELLKRAKNIQSVSVSAAEIVERIIDGVKRKFVKVYCNMSTDVSKAREIVKKWEKLVENEYEYSINFYRRYLIDNQIEGWVDAELEKTKDVYGYSTYRIKSLKPAKGSAPNLKLLAFDIESVEDGGKQKIVMLSLKSRNFEKVLTYKKGKGCSKYVEVVKDEEKLLERFVEIVRDQDPDVILGYNSDMFDFQLLRERAEEYPRFKLILSRDRTRMKFARRARVSSARMIGRVHIDLFSFIDSILATQLQTEVLSLDAVSAELLGDKKIEIEYEEILEAWKKGEDLSKLSRYCLKDSELTLRLGEFMLPQIYEMSRLCGQLLFDTSRMTYSQLVEWYLSKRAFEMMNIIPNQPKWDEIQKRREYSPYVGGFVKEPIGGLHDDIAVMDFRSLYPSIIATFNISPETFNCEDCRKDGYSVPERDYWFCKRRKGFVSTVIRELIDRRSDLKRKMQVARSKKIRASLNNEQLAVKTVTNATYGYLGFASSKWYCRECADSSAAFGRFYIKKVIDEAEKEDFTVVYGDTDSLFVKTKSGIKRKTAVFLKKTNKILPGIIELNLQGIYKRGIFIPRGVGPGTAKKRYALIDEKSKLTVRGLEKVRKDWSNVAKDTQEKVLRLILEKKDVKGSVKYVRSVIEKLNQNKIPLKDLLIVEQLTKPLSEYKAIGPHVVAARKLKERGRPVGEGMPILFAITKGKGSISERSEPFEDVKIEDIDKKYYISHQIVPAALRVLQVLDVEEEELLGESLKSFLK